MYIITTCVKWTANSVPVIREHKNNFSRELKDMGCSSFIGSNQLSTMNMYRYEFTDTVHNFNLLNCLSRKYICLEPRNKTFELYLKQ
jgi:hypothetical protein